MTANGIPVKINPMITPIIRVGVNCFLHVSKALENKSLRDSCYDKVELNDADSLHDLPSAFGFRGRVLK